MTIYRLLKDTWRLNIPNKCILQNIKGGSCPLLVYAYDVYNINYLTQFVYTVIQHFLLILTFMIY
jgi:hypothetical protein